MPATDQKPDQSRQAPALIRRKGCSIVIWCFVLLLVSSAVWCHRPRFKSSQPSQIDVQAWQPSNEKWETSITDPSACRAVIETFKRGRWTMPHMCKARARIAIRHEDGNVDYYDYMPGHDGPDFCEIRTDLGHYKLSRKDFFRVLNDAGVDTSKIPVE